MSIRSSWKQSFRRSGGHNSLWLFQNDIAKLIHTGARRMAQRRHERAARPGEAGLPSDSTPFGVAEDGQWTALATAGAPGPHANPRHQESRVF
ncbi:hypothetical protein AWC19_19490 [Mycobacterium palustre]|uniref:Uncharacterized protein n=1 Tax=Mycobacterium palustre TaxID=153971 RepID=A0A1X1Z4W9_9MYCO|nr:hypothetical protein AWC19_19490 [Mycobacterium palustre]